MQSSLFRDEALRHRRGLGHVDDGSRQLTRATLVMLCLTGVLAVSGLLGAACWTVGPAQAPVSLLEWLIQRWQPG